MIYKAIKYILENDTDFAAAIGTDSDSDIKVYPIHPRKEVSLPFCVFNIEDQNTNPTKDNQGVNGVDIVRIRVTYYSTDLDELVDIAEKGRIALDGEKAGGTFNTVVIRSIDCERISDDFNAAMGDRGSLVINTDYEIWAEP